MQNSLLKNPITETKLTRLDVYKEIDKREGLDRESKEELKRLEAGFLGENAVYNIIKEFGEDHWIIKRNVWLDYYGEFECDLLLITTNGLVTFEIKYFSGVYEFKNSQCTRNGNKIGHNAISQAQKSSIHFQNLLRHNGFDVEISGAIVFVGEHFDIKVHDKVDDLNVLMINQLRDFIWKIANEEKKWVYQRVDSDELIRFLERNLINNPFPPKPITDEMSKNLRVGVMCSHCGSFNVDTSKAYVYCACGMYEPRENAIVRTICEYGVIHFNKDLTTTEIVNFFGGDFSRRTILKYLNKYFERIGAGRGSRYRNYAELFGSCHEKFNLKRSRYLRC